MRPMTVSRVRARVPAWLACGLALGLAACGPAPSAATAPAEIAPATVTLERPAPTQTAPTQTASVTASPSERPSNTPTRTATATPEPSSTPAHTATPRPTLGATATLTATPGPTLAAPRFPETGIHAWSRADFAHEVNELASFVNTFLTYFRDDVVAAGKEGDCGRVTGLFREMVVNQAAYNDDVPADWYGLYYEYRTLVAETVSTIKPIVDVCWAGGGTIPDDVDRQVIDGLTGLVAREVDLDARVQAHP